MTIRPARSHAFGAALAAALGLLPAACSDAPGEPAPAAPPVQGPPRLEFARTTHDFGVIDDTQTHTTEFAFTNAGGAPLEIREVKTSCGCTTSTLDKQVYLPGEPGRIDVTFDPAGRSGSLSKSIQVISNAAAAPAALTILADVTPLLSVENHLIQMKDLAMAREHTRRVEYSYDDPELEITDVRATHPNTSARLLEHGVAASGPDGRKYRGAVELVVHADAPWGLMEGARLVITARGRPAPGEPAGTATYSVFVSAQVYGDLKPDPVLLMSRTSVTQGDDYELRSTIRSGSGRAFEVHAVEMTEPVPNGAVTFQRVGPAAFEIILRGTAPRRRGPLKGEVVVKTDAPGEEMLPLGISIYVR